MTSELRIIINPAISLVEKVQLLALDEESQSAGIRTYQVLSNEIREFSKRVSKILGREIKSAEATS